MRSHRSEKGIRINSSEPQIYIYNHLYIPQVESIYIYALMPILTILLKSCIASIQRSRHCVRDSTCCPRARGTGCATATGMWRFFVPRRRGGGYGGPGGPGPCIWRDRLIRASLSRAGMSSSAHASHPREAHASEVGEAEG
jgi:hypothetical protein